MKTLMTLTPLRLRKLAHKAYQVLNTPIVVECQGADGWMAYVPDGEGPGDHFTLAVHCGTRFECLRVVVNYLERRFP